MRTTTVIIVAVMLSASLTAQEKKKVPDDSVRVSLPGCTKGYIFTVGRRTADEPGSVTVPEGTHYRMNGPKKLMGEIKAQEGSMIELTGITLKGQYLPGGVAIGGFGRILLIGSPFQKGGSRAHDAARATGRARQSEPPESSRPRSADRRSGASSGAGVRPHSAEGTWAV